MEQVSGIYVFVDYSNLYVSSLQFNAARLNLHHDSDTTCCVNVKRLIKNLTDDRQVARALLYASDPLPRGNSWTKLGDQKLIEVFSFVKTDAGKEKEVDTSIAVDVTEVAITQNPAGSVIIIVGGDRDHLPAIKKALQYGWKVEVASYIHSLSKEIYDLACINESLTIWKLDDIMLQTNPPCLYQTVDWKAGPHNVPTERSFVACFAKEVDMHCARLLTMTMSSLLRWSCACFMPTKRSVCFVILFEDGLDFARLWKEQKSAIEDTCRTYEDSLSEVMQAAEYWPSRKVQSLSLANFIPSVSKVGSSEDLHEIQIANAVNSEEEEESEGSDDESWPDNVNAPQLQRQSSRVYSIQCKYHYACQRNLKCPYSHDEKAREFFATHGKSCTNYKSILCFKFGINCPYEDKAHLCPYAHGNGEIRCYTCAPWVGTLGHSSDECPMKETSDKASEKMLNLGYCPYFPGFTCTAGLSCPYIYQQHTAEEIAFFEQNNGKGVKGYKGKLCKFHFSTPPSCLHEQLGQPMMCKYAHSEEEAFCYTCMMFGHIEEERGCSHHQ